MDPEIKKLLHDLRLSESTSQTGHAPGENDVHIGSTLQDRVTMLAGKLSRMEQNAAIAKSYNATDSRLLPCLQIREYATDENGAVASNPVIRPDRAMVENASIHSHFGVSFYVVQNVVNVVTQRQNIAVVGSIHGRAVGLEYVINMQKQLVAELRIDVDALLLKPLSLFIEACESSKSPGLFLHVFSQYALLLNERRKWFAELQSHNPSVVQWEGPSSDHVRLTLTSGLVLKLVWNVFVHGNAAHAQTSLLSLSSLRVSRADGADRLISQVTALWPDLVNEYGMKGALDRILCTVSA
eukprot:ANDGO_07040.mRNA.1 hypothetical protein